MHDVFFFSYDEDYASVNWKTLKEICPHAKRIHGVRGTQQAWIAAARSCETSHFFSVDADNIVSKNFNWTQYFEIKPTDKKIRVWRAINAVNGLIYGHGAVKLWPKDLILETDTVAGLDYTCSIAQYGFEIVNEVAGVTAFNHSPFSTWKAAFRECAKLASGQTVYYGTNPDPMTAQRLRIWATVGEEKKYGNDCLLGARMGIVFGQTNIQNFSRLKLINDSEFLKSTFEDANKDLALTTSQVNSSLEKLNFFLK